MKIFIRYYVAFFLCLLLLVSCASQEPAPVEYKSSLNSIIPKANKSNVSEISSKRLNFDDSNKEEPQKVNVEKKQSANYLMDNRKSEDKYIKEEYEEDNFTHAKIHPKNDYVTKNHSKDNDDLESSLQSELEYSQEKKIAKLDQKEDEKDAHKIDAKPSTNQSNNKKLHEKNLANEKAEQSQNSLQHLSEDHLSDQVIPDKVLIKPVDGKIVVKFGEMVNGVKNTGLDFSADLGDPVKASASGVVIHVGKDANFGNIVIIKHENLDLQTAYAYLANVSVAKGQVISAGDQLGTVGLNSNELPRLHFAVRSNKVSVNPMLYLK